MSNWKMRGITSVIVIAAAATALAYSPNGSNTAPASSRTLMIVPRSANVSYASSHKDALHLRIAQSCIAHGQTCTINGTPCCNSSDTCKGTFPNTTCQ